MTSTTHPHSSRIILTTPPSATGPSWQLRDAAIRDPKDHEVLVRIVASGVCHTDLAMSMAPVESGLLYPKVMGHEGGGVVEKVGTGVTHVQVGDLVLLSFDYCGEVGCFHCAAGAVGYCRNWTALNVRCEAGVYRAEGEDGGEGVDVAGGFFGQSSFADSAIVRENSVVNVSGLVSSEQELGLFVPFGCGFMTGAATVTEVAKVGEGDSVAVFGLGGVGMLAVMAAKIRNAKIIIAVDRVQSRLSVAKECGATHTIDTSSFTDLKSDLDKAIKEIVPDGTDVNIDTTGVLPIVEAGVTSLQAGGQLIMIGIMSGMKLEIDLSDVLANGKSIRGVIEGNVKPSKFIPQLMQWYREGKLPIEKVIKFYLAKDFSKALEDMHTGATIKPVLMWELYGP